MTDPQRIAERGGFAAQLLRAGAEERPGPGGLERTLAALGVSGAVLTSSVAVSAAAGTKLTSVASGGAAAVSSGAVAGGTGGAVSMALVVKWIGIGMIGGLGFAGAASVVTRPTPPTTAATSASRHLPLAPRSSSIEKAEPAPVVVGSSAPEPAAPELARSPTTPVPVVHSSAVEAPAAAPDRDSGEPLSTEVAFVDRGRALLRAGQSQEGLALLEGYERTFHEARLLPEVLFLRLEAYERLGRAGDARGVAERLLKGFPKSPHAARARKSLEQ